jgi:leucyl aminopeptidase
MSDFKIIFNTNTNDDKSIININKKLISIIININNIKMYNLIQEINKINDLLKFYNNHKIKIYFNDKINIEFIDIIITKLSNILYKYVKMKQIKMFTFSSDNDDILEINNQSNNLMDELKIYKDIVMDPNKNPETYLEYIKSRVPPNYNIEINNLKYFDKFPLTRAVGIGSRYNTYFVHIKPTFENSDKKTIFLVGKSITYDSGGLNLKTKHMEEMKTDMAGSAIIISVLNRLAFCNYNNHNIHLLIPTAENMIGNTSTRPGQVVKSYNSKLIEITDIDAEGRLCLADCLEYINKDLLKDKDPNNCLIIDIATLTGNAVQITAEVASIVMCNYKGELYKNKLVEIGENIGEYLEYLKLRPEYLDFLKSPVGDIKNLNYDVKAAGCLIGGAFLKYFATDVCPWIHLDVAPTTFIKETAMSYGVNLLVEFIKQI